MLKHLSSILLVFVGISFSNGQAIINGDFEINTAGVDQINLSNSSYNSIMSNSFAYGTLGNIDIIISNTYCDVAQNGDWFIALTSGGTDALSLTLSSPLTAGNTYSVSFYDRTCSQWPIGSAIKIGVSTLMNNFGTTVYTAPLPVDGVWTLRTFSFVAPVSAGYITITCDGVNSGGPWTHIDNIFIGETSSLQSIDASETYQLYPIPASTVLNVQSDRYSDYRYNIFNNLGQLVITGNSSANTTAIPINLPNGFYTAEFISDNSTGRKRFVIDR